MVNDIAMISFDLFLSYLNSFGDLGSLDGHVNLQSRGPGTDQVGDESGRKMDFGLSWQMGKNGAEIPFLKHFRAIFPPFPR